MKQTAARPDTENVLNMWVRSRLPVGIMETRELQQALHEPLVISRVQSRDKVKLRGTL